MPKISSICLALTLRVKFLICNVHFFESLDFDRRTLPLLSLDPDRDLEDEEERERDFLGILK